MKIIQPFIGIICLVAILVGETAKSEEHTTVLLEKGRAEKVRYFSADMLEEIYQDLRHIENAKHLWAFNLNKTSEDEPSWRDIVKYLRDGVPTPPCGGQYVLNNLATSPEIRLSFKDLEKHRMKIYKAAKDTTEQNQPVDMDR